MHIYLYQPRMTSFYNVFHNPRIKKKEEEKKIILQFLLDSEHNRFLLQEPTTRWIVSMS